MSNIVLSKEKYSNDVKLNLIKTFDIKNVMSVPSIEKIVVSTSLGADAQDKNYYDSVKNV